MFALGYHYLSVMGLDPSMSDVALPLDKMDSPPITSGLTGRVDFDRYDLYFFNGVAGLRAGIAGISFPLDALLNESEQLLIGAVVPRDFVGLEYDSPGGFVVHYQPIFKVGGRPGRRYAWTLGGEFAARSLFNDPPTNCSCATLSAASTCVVGCTCDTTCHYFADVLTNLQTNWSVAASGVAGNLPLQPAPIGDWNAYTQTYYPVDPFAPDDPRFPRLDVDTRGKLAPIYSLTYFTDYTVPDLPPDPLTPSRTLDSMIVLGGVEAPGAGFVPLGLAIGQDCDEGGCYERSAGVFDGRVKGPTVCYADADPAVNRCPTGVPPSLPDGHIGLFRAPPTGGLQGQELITLFLALPRAIGAEAARATAIIVRGDPTATVDLSARLFPAFPAIPIMIAGRQYPLVTTAQIALQRVEIRSAADTNGAQTHWVIYGVGGNTFTGPTVPAGWVDPIASSTTAAVTHSGFDLAAGTSLNSLAAHDGSTLSDLFKGVDGFATQVASAPVQ